MSAASEQRAWQRPSLPAAVRSATSQSRSTAVSPSPKNQPSKPAVATPTPGNIWAEKAKERTKDATQKPASTTTSQEAGGAKDESKKIEAVTNALPAAMAEPHTSVNGFNAAEAKDFLARGASQATYTVADTAASKTGGAWGAKSNTMANGQPFFVQLTKQVSALQAKQ
ncbi:hypothetical protein MBLNU459_g4886t1 [Dothideomycetes sp. NU459]